MNLEDIKEVSLSNTIVPGAELQTQRLQIEPSQKEEPTWGETLSAAFRVENSVGSLISRGPSKESPLPPIDKAADFSEDAYDPIKEIPEQFRIFADSYVGLKSPQEVEVMNLQLERELEDRKILADSGWKGFVSSFAAGTLDPLMLPFLFVPGANVVATGAKATRAATQMAIAAGTGAGVSEIALQSTQEARTSLESAFNIGGATLIGGVLGAGVSVLTRQEFNDIAGKVSKEFDETLEGLEKPTAESIGAAAKGFKTTTLEAEGIARAAGIEKVLGFATPLTRVLQSKSRAARVGIQELLETPFYTTKNAEGIANYSAVETLIKTYTGLHGKSLEFQNSQYVKYRTGVEGGLAERAKLGIKDIFGERRRNERLSFRQFREEISKSLRRGDKHEIPEVQAAVNEYRNTVFNPIKDEVINLGLLPKDVDAKFADSYLTRLYNHEKIKANATSSVTGLTFRQTVRNGINRMIKEAEPGAKRREQELTAKIDILEEKIKTLTKKTEIKASQKELEKLRNQRIPSLKRADVSESDIDQIADDIINNILGTPSGLNHFRKDIVPTAGPLKDRVLPLNDTEIEEWLESDIEVVSEHYIRTMAPEIELTRKFGDKDLRGVIRDVTNEYDNLIKESKTEKEAKNLQKEKSDTIRDITASRDLLLGTYARPLDPSSFFTRANRTVREINYIRLLGGMTLSALPDLARPVMTHGLRRTAKTFAALATNPALRKMGKDEVKKTGAAWDMVLNTRARRIAEVGDEYGTASRFERGVKALSDTFGVASLMAPWNAIVKQFSGVMVMDFIIDNSIKLTKGTISAGDKRKLAKAGIDEQMATRIVQQFKKYGDKVDGLHLGMSDGWDDLEVKRIFNASVLKEIDTIIITPGIGDKPLMMNTEVGKTIGQFKSFAFASANRTLIAGLQQKDAATLNGAMIALALGAVTYGVKETLADRPVDTKPRKLMAEAIDRSGLLGYLTDVNNIVEKATRGTVGISALTGSPTMSRYASRNAVGALLGPTPDALADLIQVTGAISTGDIKKSDVHALRKLVPYQNLFYLRWLVNTAEDNIAHQLGAK